MAQIPVWFNEITYLSNKLQSLDTNNIPPPTGQTEWHLGALKTALDAADLTPFEHYQQYGIEEDLSPNSFFDVDEYLQAKADKLNQTGVLAAPDGYDQWDIEAVQQALHNAGLTAWEHFQQFGWKEGINPSNEFDISDYLDAKAQQVADLAPGERPATPDDFEFWTQDGAIEAALANAGLDPVTHFEAYGQYEDGLPSFEEVEHGFFGVSVGEQVQVTHRGDSGDNQMANNPDLDFGSWLNQWDGLNDADTIFGADFNWSSWAQQMYNNVPDNMWNAFPEFQATTLSNVNWQHWLNQFFDWFDGLADNIQTIQWHDMPDTYVRAWNNINWDWALQEMNAGLDEAATILENVDWASLSMGDDPYGNINLPELIDLLGGQAADVSIVG